MDRISWDDYFMVMALWARSRSPDESTQHGCVLVNEDRQILGIGYNGFAKDSRDKELPQERPLKYSFMIHAEENAIINSNRMYANKITAYVTGLPCITCLSRLKQVGVTRIVYGPISSVMQIDQNYLDCANKYYGYYRALNHDDNIKFVKWEPRNITDLDIHICELIQNTYIKG